MKHCVDCELNEDCIAIQLGCTGTGDCSYFIERKVGRRYTWKQLKKLNGVEL